MQQRPARAVAVAAILSLNRCCEQVSTLTVLAGGKVDGPGGGEVRVILANHACPTCPEPADVTINQVSVSGEWASATIRRIDSTHANPHAAWVALGSPNYPTDPAIETMRNASELASTSVGVKCQAGECHLAAPLTVPAHGVVEVVVRT